MAGFSSPLLDHPQPFGYKQAWWVVSAINSTAVAQVLQLEELQPCTWARGITSEPNIFVSPSFQFLKAVLRYTSNGGWTFTEACEIKL